MAECFGSSEKVDPTFSKLTEANFLPPTEWLILWQSLDPLKLPYHHPAIAVVVTPILNQQKLRQSVIPCMLYILSEVGFSERY